MSLVEVMVALAVGVVAIGFILLSYIALQRGFSFAINWSETRIAQVRVIDAMAQDLRNATSISTNSGVLPLTLIIPARFSAYESAGAAAGDPQIGGTINQLLVSSTTGKMSNANGTITVIYEQSGNSIRRRMSQTGASDAIRIVGVFSSGVSISFQTPGGAVFGSNSSTNNTIVPIVSATTGSWNSTQTVSTTLTDTVFLRAAVFNK